MTNRMTLMILTVCAALLSAEARANTFYFQIDPQSGDGPHQVLIQGPSAATGISPAPAASPNPSSSTRPAMPLSTCRPTS